MNINLSLPNLYIQKLSPVRSDHKYQSNAIKTGINSVSFGSIANYEKAKNIYSAIKESKRVGILLHKDVDADALSSGILFFNLLKKRYQDKDIQMVINQKIPKYCTNIPDISVITQYKNLNDKKIDTVIVLDCDDTRVDCYDIFNNAKTKINIDHHKNRLNNPKFEQKLRIIEPDAVSTTQVIYDNFFLPFGILPDKTMIECIMTGVVTDSGNFRNIPDPEGFSKTMDLLAHYSKTPLSLLTKNINNKLSISKQRSEELESFFAETVEQRKNIYIHKTPNNYKINYILVDKNLLDKYNIKDDEADIKETLNNIMGTNKPKCDITAILWDRENGDIRLSMRSKNRNVLEIAETFGGGGHKLAAGAHVEGNLEEAIKKVLKVIDEKY